MSHQRKHLFGEMVKLLMMLWSIALVTAPPALAGGGSAELHGRTYGEWSVLWWQWQEANFPGFDFGEGEVDCTQGQRGPVWFLGGTGAGPAERECNVRPNVHLFFPLVNANLPNPDPDNCSDFPADNCPVDEKRRILDGIFSEDPPGSFNSVACLLSSTIDSTDDGIDNPIPTVFAAPMVRTQSPPFLYSGDSRTVSDGIWVALSPLRNGTHRIHFTGGLCDVDDGSVIFDVDVTYTLNVVR